MKKCRDFFSLCLLSIAVTATGHAYADAFAETSRSEQRSFSEIDYENARPVVSRIEIAAEPEGKKLPSTGRSLYDRDSRDDSTPAVYAQGFPGTGELDTETLFERQGTVVRLPKESSDVDSSESDITTQEYGRYGDLPYSTSRVDMYGTQVSDNFPYRAVGRLFFTFQGDTLTCSASLVAPGLIVTAAHCVTEFGGQWYDDFTFVPAYFNGTAPYGAWIYEEVRVTQGYKSGTSSCTVPGISCVDDVAVLKLEEKIGADGKPYSVGGKVGWLGYAYGGLGFSDDIAQIAQFGYPSSHDFGEIMQRTDAPAILDRSTVIVETSSRQTEGSSGGPWIINFGEHAVLSDGVTFGEFPESNMVIAVTSNATLSDVDKQMRASAFTENNFGSMLEDFCPSSSTDLACVYSFSGVPVLDEEVRVRLEAPSAGPYSGIGNLQGWAISPYGIDRIEIYVDGEYRFDAPYGGERLDVGAAFPSILNSANSGFSMAFAYTNLSVGEHTILAIAVSAAGFDNLVMGSSSTFTVTKFHKAFIGPSDEVNPAGSILSSDEKGITVEDLIVDGRQYDVRLEWSTATQGFEIVEIE